jgi:hypothetical protein
VQVEAGIGVPVLLLIDVPFVVESLVLTLKVRLKANLLVQSVVQILV